MSSPQIRDPLVGTKLDGRYEIERVLGRGGMGTVYAARVASLGTQVAVKVLRQVQDDGGMAMGRFEREARSASRLGNPHIVDIRDFGQDKSTGLAFLVMEYLDGEDVGGLLGRERVLSVERAMNIVLQCCVALGAAHAASIVHRDLKPENIFLVTRGGVPDFVKIVDFGLAKINDLDLDGDPGRKLTKTGMIFGTPQYMSPEQCMGKPTDHRSDVYSLGLILYELLTGRVPFDGDTFMGVLNQHMVDPPPPMRQLNPSIQVPPMLEAVVYRCLDKKARNRPQSMGALAEELRSALETSGLHALAARVAPEEPIPEPSAAMVLTKKKTKPSEPPPPRHPPPSQPPVGLAPSASPGVGGGTDPFAATDIAQSAISDAKLAELMKQKRAESERQRPHTPIGGIPTGHPTPIGGIPPAPRAPRLGPSGPLEQLPAPPGVRPRKRRGALEWVVFALLLLVLGAVLGYGALLALE